VVDRTSEATETAAGHTGAGPAALVALDEFLGGRSMDDLRRALGLTPSGAVRLVDRLAADGCVERRPGANGRSLSLVLTARGRRVARRVQAARREALEGVLSELTGPDRAALTRVTEKLLRTVTASRLGARRQGVDPSGGWLCRLCDFDACGRDRGICPAQGEARAQQGAAEDERRGIGARP
jgi:DNA-binding MarR family transcriptional regulator